MYLNQGNIAGPSCNVASGTSVTFTSCQLATNPPYESPTGQYYITVVGNTMNLTRYELTVSVIGEPSIFLPVGDNEITFYNSVNDIYVFPLSGVSAFAGRLEFILSLQSPDGPSGITGSASLSIYFDTLPNSFCGATPEQTLSINDEESDTWMVSSCDLESVRLIYLVFNDATVSSANFEILHVKPFIRDLNTYDTIPQDGAVVGNSGSSGFDEEYYQIRL